MGVSSALNGPRRRTHPTRILSVAGILVSEGRRQNQQEEKEQAECGEESTTEATR